MLDNIDTILWDVVRTIFNDGRFGVGAFTPARAAAFINRSAFLADAKVFLSQVAFVISVVLIGVLAYIAVQRRNLKAAPQAAADVPGVQAPALPSAGAWRSQWNQIIGHLDSSRETDWKLAVMEADKLANSALQQAGFSGDTFGDRLTNIQPGDLISLDGLWWAHRIRNRIAHEMDYFLRYTEARQAISYYESTLAELQLL
jgi:hypothetical protein